MAVCPHCKSKNITFKREKVSSHISGWGHRHGRFHHGGGNRTYQYKTTAMCRDCGYTWNAGGSGCLIWVAILLVILLLISGNSKKRSEKVNQPSEEQTITETAAPLLEESQETNAEVNQQ